ncbi:MAG: hypothetical protein ACM3IL_00525, partial [Deltaproteobacteria bacterium]
MNTTLKMHMLASGIKKLYRNKIVKNLSTVLFYLIIGYSILEFILRILYPIKFESLVIHSTKKFRGDTGFSGNIYFRPSESLGYEPIPGVIYTKPNLKVNSLG